MSGEAAEGTRTMPDKKLELHYDLSEWEERAENYGTYIKVRAWDDEGHEVSIITNRACEGEWVEVWEAGQLNYRQVAGTLQFSLARQANQIKHQLRERYLEHARYGWDD